MTDGGTGRAAPPAVFLERQGYRRRRLMDAARMLPIAGAALFAVPLLWPDSAADTDPVTMSGAMLYIFAIWAALIAIAALFGIAARLWGQADRRPEVQSGPDEEVPSDERGEGDVSGVEPG